MERVLVVDDDVELCELVGEYLAQEGFGVETAHNGAEGVERALSGEYAIIVLDVMMPVMGGFDVLRRIRAQSPRPVPVLMLTARGSDVDRIIGLELGADDYLPKPFNPRELVARIRAILRRAKNQFDNAAAPPSEVLSVGDIKLDTGTRSVARAGDTVELTAAEFDILAMLLRSAGRVVTRDELAEAALGRPIAPLDRSIDMHISSLRRKLGHRVGGAERIKTLRGVGYLYAHPTDPRQV